MTIERVHFSEGIYGDPRRANFFALKYRYPENHSVIPSGKFNITPPALAKKGKLCEITVYLPGGCRIKCNDRELKLPNPNHDEFALGDKNIIYDVFKYIPGSSPEGRLTENIPKDDNPITGLENA